MSDHTEPLSGLGYHHIEEQISRGSSLTEAQRAHKMAEFQDKKVRWTGVVEEVDDDNMVYVDMDSLLYDVRFELAQTGALRLSKGERLTFVGVIDTIERFWWSVRVELRSVAIEE